jgi:hypothetical protein
MLLVDIFYFSIVIIYKIIYFFLKIIFKSLNFLINFLLNFVDNQMSKIWRFFPKVNPYFLSEEELQVYNYRQLMRLKYQKILSICLIVFLVILGVIFKPVSNLTLDLGIYNFF